MNPFCQAFIAKIRFELSSFLSCIHRLNQEKTAIEDMSPDEVEVAFKQGMKATDYVHYRDN